MKSFTAFSLAVALLLGCGIADAKDKKPIRLVSAQGPVLYGKPADFQQPQDLAIAAPAPAPPVLAPEPDPQFPVESQPQALPVLELYTHVKYEDLDNVHPRAIKKIVAVKDPRTPCVPCAEPSCVYIEICVPPCDRFKFEVKRKDHSKVEYDYGDYEVEITSKRGVVYVDYDD